jgi:hypothetical protein
LNLEVGWKDGGVLLLLLVLASSGIKPPSGPNTAPPAPPSTPASPPSTAALWVGGKGLLASKPDLQRLDGVYGGNGKRQRALERNAVGHTHGSALPAEQRHETQWHLSSAKTVLKPYPIRARGMGGGGSGSLSHPSHAASPFFASHHDSASSTPVGAFSTGAGVVVSVAAAAAAARQTCMPGWDGEERGSETGGRMGCNTDETDPALIR